MKEQLAIRELLQSALEAAQSRNARLSMRAFAKKLGIHFTTLSHIIGGRRYVSRKLAEKVMLSLQVEDAERERILGLFRVPAGTAKTSDTPLSHWPRLAISALLDASGSVPTAAVMAKRMKLPLSEVRQAFAAMIEDGQAELDKENGGLNRRGVPPVQYFDEHFKTDMLNLAAIRQNQKPGTIQTLSPVLVAMDSRKIAEIEQLIAEFQTEIAKRAGGDPDTVYMFSFLALPLIQPLSEG